MSDVFEWDPTQQTRLRRVLEPSKKATLDLTPLEDFVFGKTTPIFYADLSPDQVLANAS